MAMGVAIRPRRHRIVGVSLVSVVVRMRVTMTTWPGSATHGDLIAVSQCQVPAWT
jgi:hypothetical protein